MLLQFLVGFLFFTLYSVVVVILLLLYCIKKKNHPQFFSHDRFVPRPAVISITFTHKSSREIPRNSLDVCFTLYYIARSVQPVYYSIIINIIFHYRGLATLSLFAILRYFIILNICGRCMYKIKTRSIYTNKCVYNKQCRYPRCVCVSRVVPSESYEYRYMEKYH